MNDLKDKLKQHGIDLEHLPPAPAFGAYVPVKQVGNLIFVSGQLPMKDGKLLASGPVPGVCGVEQAQAAARQCVLNALVAVAHHYHSLDVLAGVVRVGVFVASDSGFTQQPAVANAASELLISLFGDAGRHVRAAVGTNLLPLGAAVEIEFIFEARHP